MLSDDACVRLIDHLPDGLILVRDGVVAHVVVPRDPGNVRAGSGLCGRCAWRGRVQRRAESRRGVGGGHGRDLLVSSGAARRHVRRRPGRSAGDVLSVREAVTSSDPAARDSFPPPPVARRPAAEWLMR